MEAMKLQKRVPVSAMLDPKIVMPAIGSAFVKLDPRLMIKNPVMFVVEVVAALTTVIFLRDLVTGGENLGFTFQIILWLWFTVLFANFAEAVAEGRGKAQAESLRKTRTESQAKLLTGSDKTYRLVPGTSLKVGDIVLVEAGDNIPSDGEVIEGVASVNEAAITGESAPVIRESGGDRSAVTGGTQVLSDWIRVRITAAQGSTFIDRMIKLVEGAERQKTPNEIALNILLAGLTIIFVFATVTIPSYATYAGGSISVVVLVALFVTLIPTTIGALLSAIGIAGMDRLVRFNVLAMSGRAVEAAGDVDTLLLDKTGTITLGNRQATAFRPVPRRHRAGTGGCGATGLAGRRDAGGPLDRRAGQGEIRHPQPRHGGAGGDLHSVHRADPHERRRCRRLVGPQGRGRCDPELCRRRRSRSGGVRQHRPRAAAGAQCPTSRAKSRRYRTKSPRPAARRSRSPRTAACSASSSSRISSRAASANALPNCAAWASAP